MNPLLFAFAAHAVPPADASWTLLTDGTVKVECTTVGDKPYCRSTALIGVTADKAVATFAELDKHQPKMKKITHIARLEPDVLHVVMDYPFPFTDRDYVAKFVQSTAPDGTVVFAWTPVTHAAAPETGDTVRLTWLDGEWRFKAEGEQTRVTYVWEADPGGGIPDANVVRKQAGQFAVEDIANACGTTITGK